MPEPLAAQSEELPLFDPSLLQYDPEDVQAAEGVAHVTSRKGQGLLSYARPLWGEYEEDRPKIAHILRLIRLAPVADSPRGTREGVRDQDETFLTVQYTDGRLVQVGLAYRRAPNGTYSSIPGRMYIPGVGEVIAHELDEFYRGVAKVGRTDLLVPISILEVDPRQTHAGSAVTVRGEGWIGYEQMSIVLYDSTARRRYALGQVSPERGAFFWSGLLPQEVKLGARWQYSIRLEVDGEDMYGTNLFLVAP